MRFYKANIKKQNCNEELNVLNQANTKPDLNASLSLHKNAN